MYQTQCTVIHAIKNIKYLVKDNKKCFEPHLPNVWFKGPQGATRRLLKIVPQLGTCAVLQHLDHKREQLLSQTDIVVQYL